jgi:transposase
LAQTIVVATGEIGRFPPVGHDAAYCRWVGSTKISNGKRKGQGHSNNGHPYLEWASREAAQGAIRFSPTVPRFSQRQQAKSHLLIARKAVAHKRARACYDILRDLVPFDVHKALG